MEATTHACDQYKESSPLYRRIHHSTLMLDQGTADVADVADVAGSALMRLVALQQDIITCSRSRQCKDWCIVIWFAHAAHCGSFVRLLASSLIFA